MCVGGRGEGRDYVCVLEGEVSGGLCVGGRGEGRGCVLEGEVRGGTMCVLEGEGGERLCVCWREG